MSIPYPFSAIVGQDDLCSALLIAAVDPAIGGVLAIGDRGTGKTTAIRGLAALLPEIPVTKGCRFHCDPAARGRDCTPDCPARRKGRVPREMRAVPVVDLPLGASEDRVTGALDLDRALSGGGLRFEPGLLARAHRGFLYVDEVNLLEDHLVDLLLDVAASGENVVERDGMSLRHPARFVLIGSGNPEEGDLRPQLLDRFGLMVSVRTPRELAQRIEVVRRRDRFERDPAAFVASWAPREDALRERIARARERVATVEVPDGLLERAARLCLALETDGLRGELTLMRAARAWAALEGRAVVAAADLDRLAPQVLAHRLPRDPLDAASGGARVDRALRELDAA